MTQVMAVQARVDQLRALVDPAAAARAAALAGSATPATTRGSFDSVLAGITAAGTGAAGSTAGPTGADLVTAASTYLGVPYVWGGESLAEGGLDCSGLVLRSLTDLGVTGIPRTAREQATVGQAVGSLADARPGDLLVFDQGSHIAVYVGDGRMLDAPKPGGVVGIRDVYATPTAIRRVLPAGSSGPAVATAPVATPWSTVGSALGASSGSASAQRAALDLLLSASSPGAGLLSAAS